MVISNQGVIQRSFCQGRWGSSLVASCATGPRLGVADSLIQVRPCLEIHKSRMTALTGTRVQSFSY